MTGRIVTIDRAVAGAVAQALDSEGRALRRQAMRRGNSGPNLADFRAGLRAKADLLEDQARSIRDQLHAQTLAARVIR